MNQQVSIDLTGAREVAKFLIAKAEIPDAGKEGKELLALDLHRWAIEAQCTLDDAAALLITKLQGDNKPKGFWRRALCMYLAMLQRDGVPGVEFRGAI